MINKSKVESKAEAELSLEEIYSKVATGNKVSIQLPSIDAVESFRVGLYKLRRSMQMMNSALGFEIDKRPMSIRTKNFPDMGINDVTVDIFLDNNYNKPTTYKILSIEQMPTPDEKISSNLGTDKEKKNL